MLITVESVATGCHMQLGGLYVKHMQCFNIMKVLVLICSQNCWAWHCCLSDSNLINILLQTGKLIEMESRNLSDTGTSQPEG